VETGVADLARCDEHAALLDRAQASLGGLDVALIALGTLGDQKESERDWVVAERELSTNFLSAASLLTLLGNRFEAQRGGTLAVISSVAGDRGRQSNYVYGSAKAALSTFTAGLRNRLFKSGVHVLTIKPGFVDTPMTAHLPKNALFVGPDKIARGIVRAIDRRRDVVYLPWFWRWILLIIRSVPEFVFKRLSL
jgi:short-subunit dehydrogenase